MNTHCGVAIVLTSLLISVGRITADDKQVPNTYDILNLVYRLCVTDNESRMQGLTCLDYALGTGVSASFVACMNKGNEVVRQISTIDEAISQLCNNGTTISDWRSKHHEPPYPITKVVGLSALRHIGCVLEDTQMPFTTWQVAFAKCYTPQHVILKKLKTVTPQEQKLGR